MSWTNIIGHENVLVKLRRSNRRQRLGHGFAFVGPTGVGKRLFALELAKAFLCEQPPEPLSACGVCASCKLVAVETHPDFHIVRTPEEKSELPVEVIRSLLEKLALKPTRGHGSVILIEDADDFNEESANAFLKTLEEPPVGTEIILLSTGSERLLPTIRSRVQVVHFHGLSAEQCDAVLSRCGVDDVKRRQQLVTAAEGSPGRALELNDESVWTFRDEVVAQLQSTRPNPVQLAKLWMEFAESAGREVPLQRARARIGIPLVMNHLRQRLADSPSEQTLTRLEACLHAQQLLDRRVQIILVVEQLCDRLCAL